MKLTAIAARKALKGRHHDGAGLYLLVKDSGAKSWVLRIQQNGKRHEVGLGSFGGDSPIADIPILQRRILTLAEAREKAAILRRYAKAGGNPYAERDKDRIVHRTFETVANECHAVNSESWSPKTAKAFLASLRQHVFPEIGKAYIDHIGATEIQRVIGPLWLDRPQMADKIFKHLKKTLKFAKAKGWRNAELPDWQMVLDGLPNRPNVESHFAAVPWKEIPSLVRAIEPDSMGRAALLFTILTAARSGEVRRAQWQQFDLEAGLWNRPAEIMKSGKAHAVTLSSQAIELLQSIPNTGDYVFSAPRGGPLSDMTLTKALRQLGRTETVHGFRSSFRDWAADNMPALRDAAEAALAHSVSGKTERAYFRSKLQESRFKLLQGWGDYCFAVQSGTVSDLATARAGRVAS